MKAILHSDRLSISGIIYYLIIGLLYFCYIFWIIEPRLAFYSLQPFFSFDSSYLSYLRTENLGGLTIVSDFFLQFMNFPFLGAAILSALLVLLNISYSWVISIENVKGLKGIELLPALIILSFFKDYATGLHAMIMMLLGFMILYGNRHLPVKMPVEKFIFHALSIFAAYFVFDIITAFSVALFLIIDELLFLKTKPGYLLVLWDIILLVLVIMILNGSEFIPVMLRQTYPGEEYAVLPQYWPLMVAHAGIMLLVRIFAALKSIGFISRIPKVIRHNILLVVMVILMVPYGKKYFINTHKYATEMAFYDSIREWEKILSLKRKVRIDDRIPRFLMNRALYYSGDMPEKLFSVPQEWGIHTLMLTMQFNRECTMHSSDLFFDMGYIKGAEYWALEANTYHPYAPRILYRLMQCAILLDNQAVARKYLTVMMHSPVHRNMAKNILRQLNEGKYDLLKNIWIKNEPVIQGNLYINNSNPNTDLIRLLQENPYNKMAFEYLMSYYLLNNHLGNFIHFLPYVKNFEYDHLPRTYEEALLFYYLSKGTKPSEFEYPIRKETMDDLLNFNKTLIEYRFDDRSAQPELARNFGKTYWYYLRYKSPVTTGGGLKRKEK